MIPPSPEPLGAQDGELRLTDEQVRHFHKEGFLVVDNVLSDEELGPLERVVEEFIQGRVRGMGRDLCDMSGPYTRRFEEFQIVNAVLPRLYRTELQNNIFERKALGVARQLLGDTATLDYDQFLAKRPQQPSAAFAWHQDLGYWPMARAFDSLTATCSLALDDADEENGCLRVVPGSHREPELRPHRPIHRQSADQGEREASHVLAVALRDSDRVVSLPVKRGSMTVHNERIVHGSPGNLSPRWRRTYVVAFRHRDVVEYERNIGFTHSHNDEIRWTTYLEALEL